MTVEQPDTPESPSAPSKAIATGRLYQPPTSAARAAVPFVTVGTTSSYWSANARLAVLPATSRHVPVMLAVAELGPL